MSEENATKIQFEKVFEYEKEVTQKKRQTYHSEDMEGPSFDIALSGGGIRSATGNSLSNHIISDQILRNLRRKE
jgi:hypothetical protein